MNKIYSKINFLNRPSKKTPLNAANLNKMDEAIDGLDSRVVETNDALLVERARIDNLAKLPEGSTTGDAELIDGRVDYNGNTHTNIGTHIREVSSQLSGEIENTNRNIINISKNNMYQIYSTEDLEWERGTLNGWDGGENDNEDNLLSRIRTNKLFYLENNTDIYPIDGFMVNAHYYENDGTWIKNVGFTDTVLNLKKGYYVKFVLKKSDDTEITESEFGNKIYNTALNIYQYTLLKQYMDMLSELDVKDLKSAEKSSNLLNLEDENVLIGKYMTPNGTILESSTGVLSVSGFIPVSEGKTYCVGGNVRNVGRMLTAFDSSKETVYSAGTENSFNTWTCPENVSYIRVTYYNDDATTRINESDILLEYEPYGYKLPVQVLDMNGIKKELESKDNPVIPYLKETGDLSYGSSFELEDNAVKTYKRLVFTGKINTFDKLHIGHGTTGYTANYIVIDSTSIYVYESGSLTKTYTHGLEIRNNIQVRISQDATTMANIRIVSNGESYEIEEVHWYGSNDMIFVKSDGSELTDCVFSWTCQKYSSDIFAFGDSYFGTGNSQRWIYHLLSDGHTNIFLDGYGGRNSEAAYHHAVRALKHGTPKILLWCLGMNDSDSENAVNDSWNNRYNSIKLLCETKGIEPVFATIPSTPTVINKYKNEIVRNSGYRYIDFDKAVGADEETGEWYEGMLSDDLVHPTEKGAITLYLQALSDLPELLLC